MAPRRPAQYFSPLYFLGDLSAVLHHFYIYSPLLTSAQQMVLAGVQCAPLLSTSTLNKVSWDQIPVLFVCADCIHACICNNKRIFSSMIHIWSFLHFFRLAPCSWILLTIDQNGPPGVPPVKMLTSLFSFILCFHVFVKIPGIGNIKWWMRFLSNGAITTKPGLCSNHDKNEIKSWNSSIFII